MGEVINLNRVRKQREQQSRKREAELNRVKFGRAKSETQSEAAACDRVRRELDGKKLDEPT